MFCLDLNLHSWSVSQAGMTFVAWRLQFVFVRLETDAVVNPETDRYSDYLKLLSY